MNPTSLFPLPPVRSTGADRESLTSIIARIAACHHLSAATVVNRLILPLVQGREITPENQKGWVACGAISGAFETASAWTHALDQLTGAKGAYHSLTLLDWSNFLDHSDGVASLDRRWCPDCYAADLDAGLPNYDRLLWNIKYVSVCPIHSISLESTCPHCGHQHGHQVASNYLPGQCMNCVGWLGVNKALPKAAQFSDTHFQFRLWCAGNLAQMLDQGNPSIPLESKNIALMLSLACQTYFDGNASDLAVHLHRNKSTVHGWLRGNSIPRIQSLFEISFALQLPLLAMLTADSTAIQYCSLVPLSSLAIDGRSKKRPARSHDFEYYEKYLRDVIDGKFPRIDSVKKAAEHLGIGRRSLSGYFPELTKELCRVAQLRREEKIHQQAEVRQATLINEIEKARIILRNEGITPSRRKIFAILHTKGFAINPWAYQKLIKKMPFENKEKA